MSNSETPKATLDDVLAELKSHGAKKKDFWDRLAPASTFISTVVLGMAGLWFTQSYNQRQAEIADRQGQQDQEAKKHQSRILEMQAVEKFIPYLTTDDERKKEVALLVITTLGSPEFATQFAKLNPSKGTQAAADRIMATAASPTPSVSPSTVVSKVSLPTQNTDGTAAHKKTIGWAYLGHFVANEHRWETKYFDISPSVEPASLVSSTLTVRAQTGNINVRVGMPTEAGEFLSVREVLKPGSQVKVKTVKEWSSTGYMWAEIDYET